MKKSVKVVKLFGIDVNLHYSWWIVFALLSWNLSSSFFPGYFPGETTNTYWFMGILASLLLFVLVLLHELAHSLVAKARNIKVESITLFFFGGVASITREDMKPSSEFLMAIAGPLFSFFLSGVFFLFYWLNINFIVTAISFYLAQLNLVLAIFNLFPGYPLDGGRALRAILHAYYKDLRKATHIAVIGGKIFAGFLIFVGFMGLFSGEGAGLWLLVLGGFLYFIAGMSYEQVVFREELSKIKVKTLMNKKYSLIKPEMSFAKFTKKYSPTEEDVFVVKGRKFMGILDSRRIESMSVDVQKRIKIKQISLPISQVKTLRKNDNAYTAFHKFAEQNLNLLPVVEKGKFLGIVTRKAVMHALVWNLKFGVCKRGQKVAKSLEGKK